MIEARHEPEALHGEVPFPRRRQPVRGGRPGLLQPAAQVGDGQRVAGPEAHDPVGELGVTPGVLEQEQAGGEAAVDGHVVAVHPAVQRGVLGRVGEQPGGDLVDRRARLAGQVGIGDRRREHLRRVVKGGLLGDHHLRDDEAGLEAEVGEVLQDVALAGPEAAARSACRRPAHRPLATRRRRGAG